MSPLNLQELSSLQLAVLAQQQQEQRRLLQAEPIAITGIGCRFPGGADSPEQFWQLLVEGRDATSEVPADRWNLERYYDPTPGKPGRMHCRRGGFLGTVDQFDPLFFGISPREAQALDPQQRLLLEVSWEALERSGQAPGALRGQSAGIFFGICANDYYARQLSDSVPPEQMDMYFATGISYSMAAGRLAYLLGVQGPSLAVDTACSSSLVALHLACRSLRERECRLAIAGGVNLLLSPINSLCFSRSGMMAPDGRCKTFDAAADGYVRGEGAGAVVLKRLADAIADRDPIWAVIRGSGVNQDGASGGLTVPNGAAQESLMRRVLAEASLRPEQIGYLEAHGTGTALGDPIEVKAAGAVYGGRERSEPLRLGSVKTNFGHLEGAAGVAGLIKTVLCLQQGRIPAHLHFREPNPFIPWADYALQVPVEGTDWSESVRRAAVSSFGFSGTNAHVVLESAPILPTLPTPTEAPQPWLRLSADSENGLKALVQTYLPWLRSTRQPWADCCATASVGRDSRRWRLAVPAATAKDAARALADWLDGRPSPVRVQVVTRSPRLVWLCDGDPTPDVQARVEQWQRFGVRPQATTGPKPRTAAWLAGAIAPEAALSEAVLTAEVLRTPQLRCELGQEGALTPRVLAELTWDPERVQVRLLELGYDLALSLEGRAILPLREESISAADPADPQVLSHLWLQGVPIAWAQVYADRSWRRQVLPPSVFERQRCWYETPSVSAPLETDVLTRLAQDPRLSDAQRQLLPQLQQLLRTEGAAPVWQLTWQAWENSDHLPAASWQMRRSDLLALGLEAIAAVTPGLKLLEAHEVPEPGCPLIQPVPSSPANLQDSAALLNWWQEMLPSLQEQARQPDSPLLLLTRGAHGADVSALSALAWGLGRTLMLECPQLQLQLVDIDTACSWREGLTALLTRPWIATENQWRLGPEGLQVARLAPAGQEEAAAVVPQPFAAYLITGGLGDLGLATAQTLVERGARQLWLVGRRSPNSRQQQAIAHLEAQGATVQVRSLDLTDRPALNDLFAELQRQGLPLQGIVHAAGVLDDVLFEHLAPERAAAVGVAKLVGARHLLDLSADLPLEFFWSYSSIAAWLGSPGQAAYAAANAGLDALMAAAAAQGRPCRAIAWGPWQGGGMAARLDERQQQRLRERGLEMLEPAQALASLFRLGSGAGNRAIAAVDWETVARMQSRFGQALPLLRDVVAVTDESVSSGPDQERQQQITQAQALRGELDALTPDQREIRLLEFLCLQLALVTGMAPERIDAAASLLSLGLDSLMAVELSVVLRQGLGLELSLAGLADDPNLLTLTRRLLERLYPVEQSVAEPTSGLDLGQEAALPPNFQVPPGTVPSQPEQLLLTGASGFLGAYLLAELLQQTDAICHCLVRATDDGVARERVAANLAHYGLWDPDYGDRLMVWCGDLAAPRLGLSAATWEQLATDLDWIVHNGAQLSYVAAYPQLAGPNVSGTRRVLELATQTRPKALHLVSSTAVFEAAAYRGISLDETANLCAWEGIHLGYSQTKWVADQLVVHAGQQGLPVALYRPPLISGDSRTGAWHEDDFLQRMIRGCLQLGMAPALELELDAVPVDFVARAIVTLALNPGEPAVYHLPHPQPLAWTELLAWMNRMGDLVKVVERQDWLAAIARRPDNPLFPLLPFFEQRWGSEQLTYLELNEPNCRARIDARYTYEQLSRLGIECPSLETLFATYSRLFLKDLLPNR